MALNEVQKVKILRYIGWDVRQIKSESRFYSGIIEERLGTAAAPLPQAVEAEVVSLLNRIIAIDQQIESAITRLKVVSVERIELNNSEIQQLRSERDRIIGEMIVVLRIYPPSHYGIELG